jgi:hypothetical protein
MSFQQNQPFVSLPNAILLPHPGKLHFTPLVMTSALTSLGYIISNGIHHEWHTCNFTVALTCQLWLETCKTPAPFTLQALDMMRPLDFCETH